MPTTKQRRRFPLSSDGLPEEPGYVRLVDEMGEAVDSTALLTSIDATLKAILAQLKQGIKVQTVTSVTILP